jgi:phasin
MSEATIKPKPAKAPVTAVPMFEMPKFDVPKFEMPRFEMPKLEVPAAFREFAERGVAQTKDAYEKIKAAAEEGTEMLETCYSTASKGSTEYGLKVIEIARANTNSAFDFIESLFGVKSPSELVELTTSHLRTQFETLTAQGKELTALGQKVATDATAPIKTGVEKAMKKVA